MEECNQKVWNVFNEFDITISCSGPYLPEVGGCVSFEVPTKGSPREKKLWKCRFWSYFSKPKIEEWDQKFSNVLDQFGITAPSK